MPLSNIRRDLRRREHRRHEGGGSLGIALHGLDGARRHAEANSPGRPSPGGGDAGPRSRPREYQSAARRDRSHRQHAEPGEGAVLARAARADERHFPLEKRLAFNNNSLLPPPTYPPYNPRTRRSSTSTYDKEMWLHLCSDFSPQVVRVYGTRSAPDTQGRRRSHRARSRCSTRSIPTRPRREPSGHDQLPRRRARLGSHVLRDEDAADGYHARRTFIRPASIRS